MSLICCHYSLFRACLSLAVSLSLFFLAPLLYLFLPHLRIFATVLVLCAFFFLSLSIFFLLYISFCFVSLSHHAFYFPPLVAFSSGSYILLSRFALFFISLLSMISLLSLSLSLSLWSLFLSVEPGPTGNATWVEQGSRAGPHRREGAGTQHVVLCSGGGGGPEHNTVCCVLAAGTGQNTAQRAVFWRRGRARTQLFVLCSGRRRAGSFL